MRRTATKKTQADLDARVEKREREQDNDLRAVMRLTEGRRFVLRIVEEISGVMSETFTGNSETFHREGRRSVGVAVMGHALRVAPDDWMLGLQELYAARRTEEALQQLADDEAAKDDDP